MWHNGRVIVKNTFDDAITETTVFIFVTYRDPTYVHAYQTQVGNDSM
jgi:hypothetical protein